MGKNKSPSGNGSSFANGNGNSHANGMDAAQRDWQLQIIRATIEHWWLYI